jgi:hypothetical protein
MAAVSEIIVREYLESLGFFILQQQKFIAPSRLEDDEIDFYAINPKPRPARELPFVLKSSDLASVERAVVVVKGWHSDTFSPGFLAHAPQIFRFLEPAVFQQAAQAFGQGGTPSKLLVVPALPAGEEARQQSIHLLREKGLDGVISFHTILQELISQIEVNRNYIKSDVLQVIRILKNYDLIRDPQMELFKPRRSRSILPSGHRRERPRGGASPPAEQGSASMPGTGQLNKKPGE